MSSAHRRFGFANPDALASGQTGTACRGEEHDVTLVWSITSGKRLILADGQEVHYSHSRSSVFDFSWTMRGNHVLKVVAHASPPLSPTPGFRQYDFYVDGQSFFSFPKLYRLGLAANDPRASSSPTAPTRLAEGGQRRQSNIDSSRSVSSANIASIEAPHNPDEEEAYLREAIRQSLQDSTPKAGTSAPADGTGDLLDFGGPTATAAAPAGVPQIAADPFAAFGGSAAPADPWAAPAPATNGYGYPSQPPAGGSLLALPPSGPAPAAQQPYSNPAAGTPFGAVAPAPVPVPPPKPGAPAPQAAPYGAPPQPPAAAQTPFAYSQSAVPPAVTPYGQQTPSSLGFTSPTPTFSGFSPIPDTQAAVAPKTNGAVSATDPALLSMNTLSGQEGLFDANATGASGSLADQAYERLANMDTFSLATKNEPAASNPFAASSSSLGDNRSLADMAKSKVRLNCTS